MFRNRPAIKSTLLKGGALTDEYLSVSFEVAAPCLREAIVSNLHVDPIESGWQHGEPAGDVCGRPLCDDALPHANPHRAVIALCS